MKTLTTILLLFVMSTVRGIDPVDPGEPVFQLDYGVMPPGNMWIGGKWSERKIVIEKTEDQVKAENMAIAAANGRSLMSKGISAIVLGVMLTFFLKQYHLQWVGLGISGYGVWKFSSGLIEIKLAENWQIVTGALFVGIIIIITGAMLWNSGVDFKALLSRIKQRRGK